jgi:hypothetical protein
MTVMTEHGHHATAYANRLQRLTQLIASLYGNGQTFFGRGVEARRGIPEQSPPRRAEILAVRIRYKNTVAVLRSHGN